MSADNPQEEALADLIARCPEHGTSVEAWTECRCAAARVAAQVLAGTVEPADFATVEYADGTTRTRLDRLTDGRVMCCLCFEFVTRDGLAPDEEHEGCVTDVCLRCALREAREAAKRGEAHPPMHRWRAEVLDGDMWMPASSTKKDRAEVLRLLRVGAAARPAWDDGTPVQRRLVRETTTYTVEPTPATEGTDRP